jgi:hypothetical protein
VRDDLVGGLGPRRTGSQRWFQASMKIPMVALPAAAFAFGSAALRGAPLLAVLIASFRGRHGGGLDNEFTRATPRWGSWPGWS